MTCLLLDLGNTRCKLACAADGEIAAVVRLDYADREALKDYLAVQARHGMTTLAAQVASEAMAMPVVAAIEAETGRPVRRLRPVDPMPGVRNGYRRPEQLGVDRLLAMVAARRLFEGALCVVDVGTAVTIDLVDANGLHQGGLILPGEELARDCLLRRTAIPRDGTVEAGAVLGRDTATAVSLGARHAISGVVQHTLADYTRRTGEPVRLVVGGGGGEALLPDLPPGSIRLHELVLRGLAAVALYMTDSPAWPTSEGV